MWHKTFNHEFFDIREKASILAHFSKTRKSSVEMEIYILLFLSQVRPVFFVIKTINIAAS